MAVVINSRNEWQGAYQEGRVHAEAHVARSCLDCIKAERGWPLELAIAFHRGFVGGCLNQGRQPETRCSCVLNSPFKS
ncbi:MAG TPA: hypothetical protein VGW40_07500 [Allosphingosinicella sp.]|nr:hypothetical protein [Allosphingosinicella sp.]